MFLIFFNLFEVHTMRITFSFNIIPPVISAFLSMVMILYFLFFGRKSALLLGYIWCQIMIFIWAFGQVLEEMTQDYAIKWAFIRIEYFSICFIGLSWIVFCFLFTENKRLLKKKVIIQLTLVSTFNYLVVLTNDRHQLFKTIGDIRSRELFFWIIVTLTYIYVVLGVVILIKYFINQIGNTRKQIIMLIAAVLIPFIINLLYISNILRLTFDITSTSFSLSLLFFAIATFKYSFLDVIPIARKRIVENMRDSVIVVSRSNRIIDWNSSFVVNFFNGRPLDSNSGMEILIERFKELSANPLREDFIYMMEDIKCSVNSGELTLAASPKKTYNVTVQPVTDGKGEILGRIFTLNDITEYKNLLDELNDKNHELSALNDELEKYAATVEELAVARERNRIAHDVHDTLGHTMTLLISILEVANITLKSDRETTGEKIKEAVKTARGGLKELRRSITGLVPEKLSTNNLVTSLKNMFEDYRLSGVEIDFNVEGREPSNINNYSDTVYRLCQEALTNSVRHGKAKHVNIMMRFDTSVIKIFIFDDGIGCKDIKKGFGLTGMEERLKKVDGTIVYGSDGESGFNIRVEIPISEIGVD